MSKKTDLTVKNFAVKSNALIQARYRLSLQESHVIFWLLGEIDVNDEDFKLQRLDIREFCQKININPGNRYSEMRKITKKLRFRNIEIFEPETQEIIECSWLSATRYQLKEGCVLLEFSPQLKPYLLQLKGNFTKINIADTFKLRSVHAIRIFELLLQYQNIGKRLITIDELRLYCGIEKEKYKNYFGLKGKTIEKAKTEINSKTEYKIDYTEIKKSRKVIAIEWSIKKKSNKHILAKIESECSPLPSLLRKKMKEYGASPLTTRRALDKFDETLMERVFQALDVEFPKGNIKNPIGWVLTACEEGWDPNTFKKK